MSEPAGRARWAPYLVVATALCLACSVTASGATGPPDRGRRVTARIEQWTTPVRLSPGSEARIDRPQLLADGDGNLTTTWLDSAAVDALPPGEPQLMMRRRPADTHTWAAAQVGAARTFDYCLGTDRAGTVTEVYAGRGRRAFVTRGADGTFSAPEPIAPGFPGHVVSYCAIGVSSDGAVTAVWSQGDRTAGGKHETRVVWSQLPAGADTWTRPRYLTEPGRKPSYDFWLSVGPDDSILLVWEGRGLPGRPWSRLLLAGSTRWSATQLVSSNEYLDDVVNLGGGRATAMFDGPERVLTTQRRSDGTWRPLQPIASPRKGYAVGDMLGSWRHRPLALWRVGRYLEVSIRSQGRWRPPHEIVVGQGQGWSAQAYPDGAVRVVWTRAWKTRTGFAGQLLTAVRGPLGSWGATAPITEHLVDSPSVQLLGHRSAAVVYLGTKGVMFSEVARRQASRFAPARPSPGSGRARTEMFIG